ncbi:MAG: hypothetical protein M1546_10715 [Chloroflexi bacterium]|nr:hypothetical protein [Chloroflexota bacterium]
MKVQTGSYTERLPATVPVQLESASAHLEVNRLIVLVPEKGVDHAALARRVWAMAAPNRLKVLFLSIHERWGRVDPGLRLRLITLAAMTRDDRVEADMHIEPGRNWVSAVRQVFQPGDVVICHAEQKVHVRGYGNQPLSQVLSVLLNVPVYVLAGLYHGEECPGGVPASLRQRAMRLIYFSLPLFIVALFFYLQISINVANVGIARTVLLVVSGLTEIGLIGVWASLSS